ncbi:helix-turn-helix domain-containing protein [Alcanivorax sp. JB21]|uniref:helix-turn-helix domain-containing protein n=1 Tax=Alcanivorax limicola TaxID=2874102 RepID=UPI001CC178F2|nr:helix-turn-helix domain-containing protein [Alcanivorax limicola]MBZ2188132.1 helix-turn-helix domain-containing protein [Alcanivorax limicola]
MARTLNEILESEKPEVVRKAGEKADAIILDIHLAEIRTLLAKTQVDVAQALGVKQPTVAGMERSGQDLRLSSLKRYVEALGGKVSVDIELPDGGHHSFSL